MNRQKNPFPWLYSETEGFILKYNNKLLFLAYRVGDFVLS